jgi:hypothetical protein
MNGQPQIGHQGKGYGNSTVSNIVPASTTALSQRKKAYWRIALRAFF